MFDLSTFLELKYISSTIHALLYHDKEEVVKFIMDAIMLNGQASSEKVERKREKDEDDDNNKINSKSFEKIKNNIHKYKQYLSSLSTTSVCAKMFNSGENVYSCNTCGLDPTCVQCITCFNNSNHDGHDIKMVTSGGGGMCDCGDSSSWREIGNCKDHNSNNNNEDATLKIEETARNIISTTINSILDIIIYCMSHKSNYWTIPDSFITTDNKSLNNCTIIVLHNDEDHNFEQVIRTICTALECDSKVAHQVSVRVDHLGHSVVAASSNVDKINFIKKTFEDVGMKVTLHNSDNEYLLKESKVLFLLDYLTELASLSDSLRAIICNSFSDKINRVVCFDKEKKLQLAIKFQNICDYFRDLHPENSAHEKASSDINYDSDDNEMHENEEEDDEVEEVELAYDDDDGEDAIYQLEDEYEDDDGDDNFQENDSMDEEESIVEAHSHRDKLLNLVVSSNDKFDECASDLTSSRMSYLMRSNFGCHLSIRKAVSKLIFQLFVDFRFKKKYTICFGEEYKYLLKRFEHLSSAINNSVLDYSVQLFTIPSMTPEIVFSHSLLDHMLDALIDTLNSCKASGNSVYDCNVLNFSTYEHIINDMRYVFGNDGVSKFMSERTDWVLKLAQLLLSGTNLDPQSRVVGDHVQFRSKLWEAAFTSGILFWSATKFLFNGIPLVLTENPDLVNQLIGSLIQIYDNNEDVVSIYSLFASIENIPEARLKLSFHAPYHRLVSILISKLGKQYRSFTQFFWCSSNVFLKWISPVLESISFSAMIESNLYIRNGEIMLAQSFNYKIGNAERISFYESDLVGLQNYLCAAGPDTFITSLLYHFKLCNIFFPSSGSSALTIKANGANTPNFLPKCEFENDKIILLAEKFLLLLLHVISSRFQITNLNNMDKMRYMIVHILIAKSLSYSAILKFIDKEIFDQAQFDQLLKEMTNFSKANTKDSAKYSLKKEFYHLFDPYYFRYNDEMKQLAEQNYLDVKKPMNNKSKNIKDCLYPPLPNFLSLYQLYSPINQITASRTLGYIWHYVLSEGLNDEALKPRKKSKKNIEIELTWSPRMVDYVIRMIVYGIISMKDIFNDNSDDFENWKNCFCSNLMDNFLFDPKLIDLKATSVIECLASISKRPEYEIHHATIEWILLSCSTSLSMNISSHNFIHVANPDHVMVVDSSTKKQKQEAARKKALESMKAQSSIFENKNEVILSSIESSSNSTFSKPTCVICNSCDDSNKLGYVTFVTLSKIDKCVINPIAKFSNHRCRNVDVHECSNDTDAIAGLEEHFSLESGKFDVSSLLQFEENNLNQFGCKSCGHLLHSTCFDSYLAVLITKCETEFNPSNDLLRVKIGEFMCPLCNVFLLYFLFFIQFLGNCMIPFYDEASSTNSQPGNMDFSSFLAESKLLLNNDFSSVLNSKRFDHVFLHNLDTRVLDRKNNNHNFKKQTEHYSLSMPSEYSFTEIGLFVNSIHLFEVSMRFKYLNELTTSREIVFFESFYQRLISKMSSLNVELMRELLSEYINFFNFIEKVFNSMWDSNLYITPFIISQIISKPMSIIVQFDLFLQLNSSVYKKEQRWSLIKEFAYFICLTRISLHQVSNVKDLHLESALKSHADIKKCFADCDLKIVILLLPFLRELAIFASINHYLSSIEIGRMVEQIDEGIADHTCLLTLLGLKINQSSIEKIDLSFNIYLTQLGQSILKSIEIAFTNSVMIVDTHTSSPPNIIAETFVTVIEAIFGVSSKKYQLPFSLTPKCCNLYSSKFQGIVPSLNSLFYLDYYKLPSLIDLPDTYHTLFQFMSDPNNKCRHCNTSPKEPAICLVCGELLCAVSPCCIENSKGELTRHTKSCSGDHGVFLLIRHSGLVFIYDGISIVMPSLYLDCREEEDLGLKRGKALFLNKTRWRDLQKLYSEQIIPQEVCRRRTHANGYERYAHNIW